MSCVDTTAQQIALLALMASLLSLAALLMWRERTRPKGKSFPLDPKWPFYVKRYWGADSPSPYTIGYSHDPDKPIGFWAFKDEKRVDQLVKAMNGAFEEGYEHAAKRLRQRLAFAEQEQNAARRGQPSQKGDRHGKA